MEYAKSKEILRFSITGIVSGIIDFLFYQLTIFLLKNVGMNPKSLWITTIATIIGFIVSVIINYLMSSHWVFQNTNKEYQNKHKKRNIILFYILSAIGLGISISIMVSCKAIFKVTLNINIDTWMDVGVPISNFFKWLALVLTNITFWLYALSFMLKTIGSLIFNYISRKKLIFKNK